MIESNDSSIWFSGSGGIPIWRFDPGLERFEAIRSPTVSPIQMKNSQDGNTWFTSRGIIGVVQQDNGSAKEFALGEESFPSGIFLQNQSLWVTESFEGKIIIFNISKEDGRIVNLSEVAKVPQNSSLFTPTDIIVANDLAWVTEHDTSFLTKYDIKTGEITRYPTALHPVQIVTLPYWLESDAKDGEGLWFNEHRGNRIAFFDFTNETLTEYEIPTRVPSYGYISNALTIAADQEGLVWFTELTEDKIGVVDRSVPLPFDIHMPTKQLNLGEGKNEVNAEIEITRNDDVEIFNSTLYFNVSSTILPSGLLANATVSFSPNNIDLSEIGNDGVAHVTLTLNNNGLKADKYILAVSATDGSVIKSVYLDLIVE
jgi:streptogramin lyase